MNNLKNFSISLILGLLGLISSYISFTYMKSLFFQTPLLDEWARSDLKLGLDYWDFIDEDFPNLTNSALPLYVMKARYFARDKKIDSALNQLKKSIKHNPYMGVSENIIAQLYYNDGKYDSSYFYSKIAFSKMPNNYLHSAVYINSLVKLDSVEKAEEVFLDLPNKTKASWRSFMDIISEVEDTIVFDRTIYKADSVLKGEDFLKPLKIRRKISNKNFLEAEILNEAAKKDFEENYFQIALKKLKKASKLNPYNYETFENIALIYFKAYSDSTEKATEMFKKSIQLNQNAGKSYFYLGVVEYSKGGDKDSICKLFNQSIDKGYEMGLSLIKEYGCYK